MLPNRYNKRCVRHGTKPLVRRPTVWLAVYTAVFFGVLLYQKPHPVFTPVYARYVYTWDNTGKKARWEPTFYCGEYYGTF